MTQTIKQKNDFIKEVGKIFDSWTLDLIRANHAMELIGKVEQYAEG